MLHATVWATSSVSRLRTWRRARVWNMHAFFTKLKWVVLLLMWWSCHHRCGHDRPVAVLRSLSDVSPVGSSVYHNLTSRGSDGPPALYDGYARNYLPTHTHSGGNEATSTGVEVCCAMSLISRVIFITILFNSSSVRPGSLKLFSLGKALCSGIGSRNGFN